MDTLTKVPRKFASRNLLLINQIQVSIISLKRQNKKVTVKAIHDLLVLNKNTDAGRKSYKHLSEIISEARLAGLIKWDAIEGRRQLNESEKNG